MAYSRLASLENATALESAVVLATTATSGSPEGMDPLTADVNYATTPVNGTLTVEANARFASLELGAASRVTLRVTGRSNLAYRIQWSPDLDWRSDFASVTTDGVGAAAHVETTDPVPGNRFFDVLWPKATGCALVVKVIFLTLSS